MIRVPAQYPNHIPTKIAFVTDMPGDEDREKGIPLAGNNGRVFNSMLRTAALERADFHVTTVWDDERPEDYTKLDHTPYFERLRNELLDVRPNVIVPLGGPALWAFTGDASIQANRGTILPATRIVPGAKLLPTFHPLAIVQQWKFFSVVVGDLLKAVKEAERGPAIVIPHKELTLEPNLDDIRGYKAKLFASDLLSVDIETGWGQITCIGFAPNANEAICVPFVDRRKANRSFWDTPSEEIEAWKLVREIMEHPVPKLGQNFAGYDAYWFAQLGIHPRNLRHDTRLLHHALYPELPKDLEFMGASYTQQGAWKNWSRRKGEKRDD